MLNALLYLRITSFRNWLRVRARRLRQPKYLVGALVGSAYFYFFFFRKFSHPSSTGSDHPLSGQALQAMEEANVALPTDWILTTTAFGSLALLAFISFMWIVPTQRAALGFTEAEVAFLFPAPISRRGLVHFRLLSSQLRSLIGATVMMLLSNRWTVLGGNIFTHAVGWWFIFSALNLHFSGAKFTLTRLADAGLPAWRRRVLVLAGIAVISAITIARLPDSVEAPALGTEISLPAASTWLIALTATAPLHWLLLPFSMVLGPFLAFDTGHFWRALGPALVIITVHYWWVVRSAVAFEDASVEYAQKRGERLAAWRSGERRLGSTPMKGRRGPFPLGDKGRPELAFLWKNLLSTWPYFTVRVFLVAALVIVALAIWLHAQTATGQLIQGIGATAGIFGGYVLVVGPQFARQDIRRDLAHAEILKTYPLAGWQIILGELLTPIVILTGLLWLTLLTVGVMQRVQPADPSWLSQDVRMAALLAMGAIMPAVVTLQLLVPNAAALLFPAWFQVSRTRGGGPEVIGQRMIFFFAQILTMLVALLPPVAIAVMLVFIVHVLLHTWLVAAILFAALGVMLVLLAEVGCGVWWLGQRFERLDLSTELRT